MFYHLLNPTLWDKNHPMAITVENAKELSIKANKVRWDQWREDKANGIIVARIAPVGVSEPLPINPFVNSTLLAVRERIEEILDEMKGAPPGCEKLANALGKLAEIERQLSGRPMPGSLKPQAARQPKASTFNPPAPADDTPAA